MFFKQLRISWFFSRDPGRRKRGYRRRLWRRDPKERSRNPCGKCRNGSSFSNGDAGTFRRSLYHTGIGADEAQAYASAL